MGRLLQISSTPLPQLLPHLHERLDLARAGKMVVEKAAIAVCLLVEFPDGWQAEMREVVTEFLEVLLAQHLRLTLVGTPGHAGQFYNVRFYFAMRLQLGREPGDVTEKGRASGIPLLAGLLVRGAMREHWLPSVEAGTLDDYSTSNVPAGRLTR
jgi:hypothetical protein